MRRSSRGYIINVILFTSALLLVLYINRPTSHPGIYSWNVIRYKTTASTLPEKYGICPGMDSKSRPALVVSRVKADGDSAWLHTLSDKYHVCVYEVDANKGKDPQHLHVPANRGHEAMSYLTFIIDNYDNVPEAGAIFVHGSRWAWHNDHPEYDNAALLATLNVTSALDLSGYHNLRCDWSASTCLESRAPTQGSLETFVEAMLNPYNARAVSDASLPYAMESIFGNDEFFLQGKLRLDRLHTIRSQCCAQFAVSRGNIQMHAREEYVALRQWLLDNSESNQNAAPADDRVAGRILSYVWHVLFLGPPEATESPPQDRKDIDLRKLNKQACPPAAECYCRLYGLCHLTGCSNDRCSGRYQLPPDYRLPKDWADLHS